MELAVLEDVLVAMLIQAKHKLPGRTKRTATGYDTEGYLIHE